MSDTLAGLKRKIAGATDLRTVVRTMKALAASSIGQYEQSVHSLDEYHRTVQLGLGACFRDQEPTPLATRSPSRANTGAMTTAVVFGSDQGLVGRFNDVIVDLAVQVLSPLPIQPEVWAIGERAHAALVDSGLRPLGLFAVPDSIAAITPLIGQLIVESEAHRPRAEGDVLHLFHNRPTSRASYVAVHQRLLPLDEAWRNELVQIPWPTRTRPQIMGDQASLLPTLLREYLFVSLFRACAESLASENASRLAAMQRADKNIDDLLEGLMSTFHRSRQNGIDEELFDVISGFEALR